MPSMMKQCPTSLNVVYTWTTWMMGFIHQQQPYSSIHTCVKIVYRAQADRYRHLYDIITITAVLSMYPWGITIMYDQHKARMKHIPTTQMDASSYVTYITNTFAEYILHCSIIITPTCTQYSLAVCKEYTIWLYPYCTDLLELIFIPFNISASTTFESIFCQLLAFVSPITASQMQRR